MAGQSTSDSIAYGPLDTSMSFLLRIAQLKTYDRLFTAAGERPFRPGETTVLWMIHGNPGIRQRVVAQRLMIKPPHMTKLIRALEEQGLVARRIPDEDRRAVELTLTPAGVAKTKELASWFFDLDQVARAPLTAKEQEQLMRLLRKLSDQNG